MFMKQVIGMTGKLPTSHAPGGVAGSRWMLLYMHQQVAGGRT